MKIKPIYALSLALSFVFISCEKDDLCDGTDNQTPRLHLTLLDQFNVSNKKPAEYVKAYIVGEEKFIEATNSSDMYLPLLPGSVTTEWVIEIYDVIGTDKEIIGSETLTFTYAPENIYISKACGYKTNFSAFSYVKQSTSTPWIGGISLTTNAIIDEANTHIQIFY